MWIISKLSCHSFTYLLFSKVQCHAFGHMLCLSVFSVWLLQNGGSRSATYKQVCVCVKYFLCHLINSCLVVVFNQLSTMTVCRWRPLVWKTWECRGIWWRSGNWSKVREVARKVLSGKTAIVELDQCLVNCCLTTCIVHLNDFAEYQITVNIFAWTFILYWQHALDVGNATWVGVLQRVWVMSGNFTAPGGLCVEQILNSQEAQVHCVWAWCKLLR